MVRDGIVLALIPALWRLFPLISGPYERSGRGGRTALDGWSARVGPGGHRAGARLRVHLDRARHDSMSECSRPATVVSAMVFVVARGFLVLA